ncbi:kinase-like domain-containing protein [Rhodocollybia butyracea]|uniref:Kinase-like domain-containing protein n=1 Tax=Rhodocollybia butyracea TaxID=206335 RepID=A0A9P5U3W9_9AGAR|nr:kinase-like domain-containing protein [Rhodocollybia butyracea]
MYGMVFVLGNMPAVVTPHHANGNINQYLRKNPSADLKLLLAGVASGLQYLHELSPPVSHGDLRGCNIFIGEQRTPILCNIGQSQMPTPPNWTIPSDDGARWMAPEVMDPCSTFGSESTTPMSDVYSFGMTMLELYTGSVPFPARRFYGGVILDVVRGIRPSRPSPDTCANLTDELWNTIQSCWVHDPSQRPTMKSVSLWLHLINRVEVASRFHV